MRVSLGQRIAASALATALLLGAGQSLVAETVVFSNNTAPGDWVGGSATSVPLVGSGGGVTTLKGMDMSGSESTSLTTAMARC